VDLLLGDRQVDRTPELLEELVGPGVGGDHQALGPVRSGLGLELVQAAGLLDLGDPGVLDHHRAPGLGKPPMSGVRAGGGSDARGFLEHHLHIIAEPPLRPAPHGLPRVHPLVRHAHIVQRPGVVAHERVRALRVQVEPAGPDDQLLTGLLFHLRPRGVGIPREPDVRGRVVAQPDDPRVVLAGPAVVAELETLQPQCSPAHPSRGPVESADADPAQADHRDLELAPLGHAQTSVSVCA
jgi:hypothetical protein